MNKVNFRESRREEPTNNCHIQARLFVFNRMRSNSDDSFVYRLQARYKRGFHVDVP